MARGLGRGGRPLGSGNQYNEPETTPGYSQSDIDMHNAAVARIQYYRSPEYPGFGTDAADTMIREASTYLINGRMERL